MNFLPYDLSKPANCKEKINTGVTFYFIDFEADFLGRFFSGQQVGNKCFKTLIWNFVQISQLILNLIELDN